MDASMVTRDHASEAFLCEEIVRGNCARKLREDAVPGNCSSKLYEEMVWADGVCKAIFSLQASILIFFGFTHFCKLQIPAFNLLGRPWIVDSARYPESSGLDLFRKCVVDKKRRPAMKESGESRRAEFLGLVSGRWRRSIGGRR